MNKILLGIIFLLAGFFSLVSQSSVKAFFAISVGVVIIINGFFVLLGSYKLVDEKKYKLFMLIKGIASLLIGLAAIALLLINGIDSDNDRQNYLLQILSSVYVAYFVGVVVVQVYAIFLYKKYKIALLMPILEALISLALSGVFVLFILNSKIIDIIIKTSGVAFLVVGAIILFTSLKKNAIQKANDSSEEDSSQPKIEDLKEAEKVD